MAYNYNINGNGQSIEQYYYDEFGIPCFYKDNEAIGLLTRSIQPFGFNGYEMDEVGGLYFAQARRYDAGVDFVKELTLLKQECRTIFGKHFQIWEGFLREVVFIL